MSFIAKQPNGLYCRFSSIVDCPTDYNMTKQDYIDLCMERAKEEALKTLEHDLTDFSEVEARFMPNNMTEKEFKIIMKKMTE